MLQPLVSILKVELKPKSINCLWIDHVFLILTVKTKMKLDDWFKIYGPLKYLLGSHLGTAILCILPIIHLTSNQVVVPVWMYEIFYSCLTIFTAMPLTMWRNNEQLFVARMLHNLAIKLRCKSSLPTVGKMVSYHSNQPFTFSNEVNLQNSDIFWFHGNWGHWSRLSNLNVYILKLTY